MGITPKKIEDGAIHAVKLAESVRKATYVFERCDSQPAVALLANGYADPTAAGPNRILGRNGLHATYTQRGTQTILGPVLDVDKGLNVTQDQTDDDGVEYIFGALGLINPFVHVVGTTPDSFIRVKMRIADVSGTDDCALGFRKNEAIQANIDDYDEAAFINVILGDVKVETILNAAATVTTDSGENWADDATHELEVQIRGRRAVFLMNGVALPGITEFNFDTGEVLVPFFFHLQATTTPGKVWFTEVEMGPMSARKTAAASDPL